MRGPFLIALAALLALLLFTFGLGDEAQAFAASPVLVVFFLVLFALSQASKR